MSRGPVPDEPSRGKGLGRSRFRLPARFLFALGTILALCALGWWISGLVLHPGKGGADPLADPLARVITAATLSESPQPKPQPTQPPTQPAGDLRFKSGQELYVHFALDRSCTLFAATLEAQLALIEESRAASPAEAGSNTLGPFALDNNTGRETFIILAALKPLTAVDFRRILGRAADSARAIEPVHAKKLEAILAAIRAHEGLAVQAVTFEHLER